MWLSFFDLGELDAVVAIEHKVGRFGVGPANTIAALVAVILNAMNDHGSINPSALVRFRHAVCSPRCNSPYHASSVV